MPDPVISQKDVQELLDSIVAEQKAMLAKLPLGKKIIVELFMVAALIGALAACAVLSGLTGPALLAALACCVAAILVAIGTLMQVISEFLDESGEADEIERKTARLERLKGSLAAGH